MALGKWFRKLRGKEQSELSPVSKDMYVLKTDTQNTANILTRARDSVQVEKVTTAIQQLEQIWTKEEQRNLVKIMLMIDGTYPHLEKMADLNPLSAGWLAQLVKAMEITNEGAEQVLKVQEELSRLMDEFEKRTP